MAQQLNIWQHGAAALSAAGRMPAASVAAAAAPALVAESGEAAMSVDHPSTPSIPAAAVAAHIALDAPVRSQSSASLLGPLTQGSAAGSVTDADAYSQRCSESSNAVPLTPLQQRRTKRKARSVRLSLSGACYAHGPAQ